MAPRPSEDHCPGNRDTDTASCRPTSRRGRSPGLANTKSAMKRIRQSENRRLRNRTVRSKVRTAVKTARTAVTEAGGAAWHAVLEALLVLDTEVITGGMYRHHDGCPQ